MAFSTLSGFDVEHASSLLVYENLFPEIQHINGKGVTDKYTKTNDVESVTYIDVMRVLPYAPRFRQLGATNNGAWHNGVNTGYNNAPESTHFTINVDLIYDEGIAITNSQIYSNPVALKAVVLAQLVKTAGMAINIITYAKQLEGFFRNGDNFDKSKTHTKGEIVQGDITDAEIASCLFYYDKSTTGVAVTSPAMAFINANASLTEGIPSIGAFVVPMEERQAFVSPAFDVLLRGQYMQNASEASARILATGWLNPFNDQEGKRIDARTGVCGMYDGVDLFQFNKVTRNFVYVALGILGTGSDSNYATHRALLDQIGAIIVYGAGTCRGIVGPSIEANPNPYYGGVYILPKMKVGVHCITGETIKLVIDGGTYADSAFGSAWTKANIAALMNTLTFTPIDGSSVKGNDVISGFNSGSHN